jgi:hypothetical protein
MFLANSRYATVPQVETPTGDGRSVKALKLRALAPTSGESYQVKDEDRLDLLAHTRYADATKFWHVADANTALDAPTLTAETGSTLKVPRT